MKKFLINYLDITGFILLVIGAVIYIGFDNSEAEFLVWMGLATNGIGILIKPKP